MLQEEKRRKAKKEDDPPEKKKKGGRAGKVKKLGIRDLTVCFFLVSF